jgi:hypothetical protein
MVGADNTDGREDKCIKNLVKNLEKRDHLIDLGIAGRIIVKE